ncbi:Uncharacterised protein [Mannheimia haemolytica]|uniref:Lipoprotein n=1 Tax=Mannheimia haemolytica TaxID=75985 RepID=A0A3S4Z767_MANHA|nr:hypothetical protein M3704_04370 [Mannheimia haemolytica]STY63280.1 Uncharacterised protein [Mannheimia haemolytica]VEI77056.1 Uncharacterised protein [Mannheimia haemolytica]
MKFLKYLCCLVLLTGCKSLEQFEEDWFSSAESANRHSSVKITAKKEQAVRMKPSIEAAQNKTKIVNQTVVNKRINTTACKDSDDWYLDGYRVGKSFRTQKNQMLQQRSQYCGYNVKDLPSHYYHNWERGFRIGIKS